MRRYSSSEKARANRKILKGEPFVGPAGLLDEMLTIIDLSRETCYIANIVKCRPPHNRDPLQVEQEACIGWLRAQTKLLQPKHHRLLRADRGNEADPRGFQNFARTRPVDAEGRDLGSRRSITPPRCCATRASGPMRSAISKSLQAKVRELCSYSFLPE